MTARRVLVPTMPAPQSGMDWRHRGACVGIDDPDRFFPVGEGAPVAKEVQAAKTVCLSCPVISQCLTWALETRQRYGVWGGLSEQEREYLIRRDRHPAPTLPRPETCDECGSQLDGKRTRYCSEAHRQRGRDRETTRRRRNRKDGAA